MTCDTEVGKDAVLLVLVSLVGLEALALAVVPKLQRVVQGRRQDVFSYKKSNTHLTFSSKYNYKKGGNRRKDILQIKVFFIVIRLCIC